MHEKPHPLFSSKLITAVSNITLSGTSLDFFMSDKMQKAVTERHSKRERQKCKKDERQREEEKGKCVSRGMSGGVGDVD